MICGRPPKVWWSGWSGWSVNLFNFFSYYCIFLSRLLLSFSLSLSPLPFFCYYIFIPFFSAFYFILFSFFFQFLFKVLFSQMLTQLARFRTEASRILVRLQPMRKKKTQRFHLLFIYWLRLISSQVTNNTRIANCQHGKLFSTYASKKRKKRLTGVLLARPLSADYSFLMNPRAICRTHSILSITVIFGHGNNRTIETLWKFENDQLDCVDTFE